MPAMSKLATAQEEGGAMRIYLVIVPLVLALLHFASSVFMPLFFAFFLIAIAWPVQNALQRRLPKVTDSLFILVFPRVWTLPGYTSQRETACWKLLRASGRLGMNLWPT